MFNGNLRLITEYIENRIPSNTIVDPRVLELSNKFTFSLDKGLVLDPFDMLVFDNFMRKV